MKKWFQGILAAGILLCGFWFSGISSLAADVTVLANTANIRAEANISSTVVGSAIKGDKIAVEGAANDSSGKAWYKVSIGGNNYGYISSDVVKLTGTVDSLSPEGQSSTAVTAIPEQNATISQASVNVRKGAGTSYGALQSIPQGTAIILTGEATATDGKKWYQIKCNYNNQEITGFVQADLVTPGELLAPADQTGDGTETAEVTEGETGEAETPESEAGQEAQEEHKDYTIVYEQDADGVFAYYLYNYVSSNKQKVEELLNFSEINKTAYQKQINNGKIIIIILAVVIVILALVVTLLLFKIRDLYYGDEYYEEEDDEEEEVEDAPKGRFVKGGASPRGSASTTSERRSGDQKREPGQPGRKSDTQAADRSQAADRYQGTGRTKAADRYQGTGSSRPPGANRTQGTGVNKSQSANGAQPKTTGRQTEGTASRRPRNPELRAGEMPERPSRGQPGSSVAKKPSQPRKPQNFLTDDDEFEFEFLNMDDKNF